VQLHSQAIGVVMCETQIPAMFEVKKELCRCAICVCMFIVGTRMYIRASLRKRIPYVLRRLSCPLFLRGLSIGTE
jgi:hypothetical protein